MSFRKSLGALACAGALCFVSAVAHGALATTPIGQPVVLGEWHNSYADTRALAFSQDIPLLAIWGSTTCSYCDKLDNACLSTTFRNWQASRQIVMLYGKNTATENNTLIKAWTKNDTLQWPYVLVYWKGQTWKFTGRFSATDSNAKAQQFIDKIESYIGAYVPGPKTPPPADAFDPADNAEAGATRLAMAPAAKTSRPHYLNQTDTADWFSFTNILAGLEYRVWISELAQTGAANLTATFYSGSSAVPFTNIPLSSLAAPYVFMTDSPSNVLVKVSRNADTNATVTYAFNYREWVPCTVSFDSAAAAVSETATQLLVPVRRSGDPAATSATLTFRDGTATAGQDYVATPVVVTWPAGGSDVQTARVPLINTDRVWEGDETFFIDLAPDPATAVPGALVEQTVTINDRTAPVPGALGYTAYDVGAGRRTYSSRTRMPAREGDGATLWVARSGGDDLPATASFDWSDGSPDPDPLAWANGEAGEKPLALTIPTQPGYQPARTLYLDLAAAGAAAATGKTRATFTVTDEAYLASVAAYVAQNPGIPFRTSSDAWFQTQGAEPTLRCAPPAPAGASVLTATLAGPGVLTFTGALSDSGLFTVAVGRGAPQPVVVDGSQQVVVIPAGAQLVTWRFARDGGSDDQSFASLTAPAYARLEAAQPLVPVAGSVVREGPLTLRWSDAFAAVRDIDGLVREFRVYAGASASSMTLVGGPFAASAPAPLGFLVAVLGGEQGTGSLVAPPEPVTSMSLDAAAGPLYWRVDLALGDGATQVEVKGAATGITVVPVTAPAFAVEEEDLAGQPWFDALLDGGTVQVTLRAGVRAAVGPLPLDVAEGAAASARVKTGRLPAGLSATVEDGAVWLRGVPTAAGAGTAVLQVSSKVGATTTAGTTLALAYTVLALPAEVTGSFNGSAEFEEDVVPKDVSETAAFGLATMTVAASGRISGKFTFAGQTFTFSAAGFDELDDDPECPVYSVAEGLEAVSGTTRVPIRLDVCAALPGIAQVSPALPGQASMITGELCRNAWRDRNLDPELKAVLDECKGYYTVSLPDADPDDGDEFGFGYVTLTVSSTGSVRASGRLADGTAVSMSGTLLLDNDGKPYTVLFNAPRAYAGGFFFARVAFERPAESPVLLNGYAVWRNRSAAATETYGAGFNRLLDVQGGFYNKLLTLVQHYADIETFNAEADTWEQTVALVVNTYGTSFVVAPGEPNPYALRVSASRATGLFSGSLRPAEGESTVSLWGALTPALADPEDGDSFAGRGFFYETIRVADPAYTYRQSHGFAIVPGCDGCGD